MRDPRDVLVSYYFQYTRRERVSERANDAQFDGTISDFIRQDIGALKSIVAFYNIWIRNRTVPRVIPPRCVTRRCTTTPPTSCVPLIDFLGLPDFGAMRGTMRSSLRSSENMRRLEETGALRNNRLRAHRRRRSRGVQSAAGNSRWLSQLSRRRRHRLCRRPYRKRARSVRQVVSMVEVKRISVRYRSREALGRTASSNACAGSRAVCRSLRRNERRGHEYLILAATAVGGSLKQVRPPWRWTRQDLSIEFAVAREVALDGHSSARKQLLDRAAPTIPPVDPNRRHPASGRALSAPSRRESKVSVVATMP